MQKIFILSSLLISALLADNHLGEPISSSSLQKKIEQTKAALKKNQQMIDEATLQTNNREKLKTRLTPKRVKNSFKKDHHRYDKRYSNFDYDRNSYYNNDGYYYGYYDTTGYFYNNIFFTYNNQYTYNDRYYRRGHFSLGYPHRRHYVYHRFNDWNRVHCYREPNVMVRGHYYDRSYYPRHHNHHDTYRTPSRMSVTRMNGSNRQYTNRHYNNRNNYSNHNMSRSYNHRNNYYNRNSNYRNNTSQPRRNITRMTTRNSSSNRSSSRHMSISK